MEKPEIKRHLIDIVIHNPLSDVLGKPIEELASVLQNLTPEKLAELFLNKKSAGKTKKRSKAGELETVLHWCRCHPK